VGFTLDIDVDVSAAQRKLFNMENTVVQQAAARAINRTLSQVKMGAVRELKDEIGSTTGLSSAGLRKSIKERKATRYRLRGELIPSGRAIPLIRFGARQVKQGVTAKAWGKRKLYKGTFVAKMPSGHKGVYKRTGNKRLPIKEMYGPALPKEFAKDKIVSSMTRIARTAWPRNFNRELKYRLSRLK